MNTGATAAVATVNNDDVDVVDVANVDHDNVLSDDGDGEPCAICMCAFDVRRLARGGGGDGGDTFADVMVCPCEHVFHTECLTRWMDQAMQCPTCRAQLPTV
jgi:hypothetical protein